MEDNIVSLNNKFLSASIENLITFYDSFNDRESLIKWMRERPKNKPTLKQVPGVSDVVVVIPTADSDSQRVRICSNSIYNGIQQVIVESVKPRDPFFNYSHNVNCGVREALKFDPKWIIISNDDMLPIDGPQVLLEEIRAHDYRSENTLFTLPQGKYHSFNRFIGSPTALYSIITHFHPNRNRLVRFNLWKKFGVKYLDALYSGPSGALSRLLYKPLSKHLLTGSFTVLSRNFVEKEPFVMDETFINGGEDTDLSLRLYRQEARLGYIRYNIGDMIGTSLGSGWTRIVRNVVNEIYLSYKIEKGILDLNKDKL